MGGICMPVTTDLPPCKYVGMDQIYDEGMCKCTAGLIPKDGTC